MKAMPVARLFKHAWIPLVLVVVLAISGVGRIATASMFGSKTSSTRTGAGASRSSVQPKISSMTYTVLPGNRPRSSYFDPDAKVHEITATLPWSITLQTTLPTVSAPT